MSERRWIKLPSGTKLRGTDAAAKKGETRAEHPMVAVEPHYYGHELNPKDVDAPLRPGEGSWIVLRRYENDRTLRGSVWNECCACGFVHCITFEVLKDPDKRKGLWWIVKRSYADEATRPKAVTKRVPPLHRAARKREKGRA